MSGSLRRPVRRRVLPALVAVGLAISLLGCAAEDAGPADDPPGSGAVSDARTVERGVIPAGCVEVSAAVVRVTATGATLTAPTNPSGTSGTSGASGSVPPGTGTSATAELDRDIAAARAVVPEQIKADFDIWASTYQELGSTLAELDRTGGAANPANADRYASLSSLFEQPAFKTAAANLDAYFTDNCGPNSATTDSSESTDSTDP